MAIDNDSNTIARDETFDLISSDKVEGTHVYNRDGEHLGTITNFMVGKRDGKVRYAILTFGGLFGMGDRHYPLPWEVLTYDTDKGGYAVDLDKDVLKNAPSFERGSEPSYDRTYDEQVQGYYGLNY
jgi:hypothetical protein